MSRIEYAIVGFDSDVWFEEEVYKLLYQERELRVVRKQEKEQSSCSNQIVIETTTEGLDDAHAVALKFLSELSWRYDVQIYSISHAAGNPIIKSNTQFNGHRGSCRTIDLKGFAQLQLGDKQMFAVGLYREAFGGASQFFSFLGYFKIIELAVEGRAREAWFKDFFLVRGWVQEGDSVVSEAKTLSDDLYNYARHGVAHANNMDMSRDPSSFWDYKRMKHLCAVIRDAAIYAMRYELNIPK